MRSRVMMAAGATMLALIAISAPRANAQQPAPQPDSTAPAVRPGDPSLRGTTLRPHTNRWTITYLTPDGKPVPGGPKRVALWYDSVWITPLAGKPAVHRKQVLFAPTGTVLETIDSWADASSLAPIRTENTNLDGTVSVREYAGRHVTGSDPDSTAPGGKRAIDITLAEPVFDFFGGMYDLLLSGFPLRNGYRARFPADIGGATGGAALQWVTISVEGKERIQVAGSSRAFDAWHVITGPTPVGRFEFWIADEVPYMIRMWYIGPRGGKQVWEMGRGG